MRNRTSFHCGGVLAVAAICWVAFPAQAEMQSESRPLGGTTVATGALTNEIQAINSLRRDGRYDEAETRCLQLVKQNPDDPSVRTLLVEIESERGQQKNTRASLKRKIESLVIPEVNVREASLVDVMDFLQKQGQTLSADKAPINFVWQVPEQAKTAKVTLSLHDVPLADALKYVTQSCGLRYRVDPHAIVIFQPVPAPPANSPSPHAKP